MNKKRRNKLIVLFSVIAAIILAHYIGEISRRKPEYPGIVEAEQVKLTPGLKGTIEWVAVREGDKVLKGELIATLALEGPGSSGNAAVEIVSPVDGVVVSAPFKAGDGLSPDQTLFCISSPEKRWVRLDLDESARDKVKPGTELTIKAPEVSRDFKGEVFETRDWKEQTSGGGETKGIRAKVRVDDPERILQPGMTVMARLP